MPSQCAAWISAVVVSALGFATGLFYFDLDFGNRGKFFLTHDNTFVRH